ncbi:hypothetical protein GCM10010869_37000 [Mesorhizobium tianshanense]|uniref:Uncharacterized protein n=1 Tax=Mesorhizobium tianshanense TaxID=39844 RepID=A0A562MCJ8_9HYPH|nr:pentapeptide repeat-containing protein [Mesorhizobium tianshanense]TWI17623.1 hypothetical protein IQ26_07487 [Mesorhizobium tianshanense]GLS38106.1 hypothetical protein GCM10010869_37000 [Mesorhizobium tianshanense]
MINMKLHMKKDLTPGAAIRYWQLGAIAEDRFDVPDAPMKGEMDPFFFLTKHKNFIPHEYPCRTIFAERYRGKRPDVRGSFDAVRWWLPFGSPRVDLSGFWFRPTRLATWARTFVAAEDAGTATIRLGTCGGAVLWLNGIEIGWTAPYGRNLEAKSEFALPLKAGINEIIIFFDDLAERDARYFFQLDYLEGPRANVAVPVPIEGGVADAIEAALEGMHFDKTAYFSGDINLLFAESLPVDVDVNVAVEGDFMSTERFDYDFVLKAGDTHLVIGPSENAPADFRHFRITLNVGGFISSRSLGVEICHTGRQGTAPPVLSDRITEALDEVSEFSERDTVRAFARLASGRAGADTDAMIEEILPSIEDCHDCADFSLVPLIWSRTVWGMDIGEATRARIDKAILGFRYWMDEPGNDVQWYFSENHALLFHTSAYLAGHLLSDKTFARSGRTGAEQNAVGAARVRAWLDHFEAWEMAEFNSAPYFPIDLKGLTALAALSPDADIVDRARKGIIRLCEVIARSAHHGMVTAAQGRSYEHTLCAGRSLELSGVARLLWGVGWYGRRVHALPHLAVCLRDHGLVVPESLVAVACHQADEHQEWRFAQGENRFAALYHYKSRDFAMGSAADYRWNEWGYQETVLHLRLGERPEAAVWINHPGETIQFGYGRPSFWGGCGSLPRAHQFRGLAVLDFSTFDEQPDFTHAWFPIAEFDESTIRGRLAMACSSGGAVILLGSADLQLVEHGPSANAELRQYGRSTRWIVRVCEASGLDDVESRFASLEVEETANGSLVIQDPDYGAVIFRKDGSTEAERRVVSPKEFTVAGEVTMLAAS